MAQPTARDALRLIDAFRSIYEEAEWMKVIELAEALAKKPRPEPAQNPEEKPKRH